LIHANVAPGTLLVNVVAGTVAPLQTTILAGTVTVARGFTVIVYVDGVPGQLFAVGVTVIVAVIGVIPALVAVNEGTFPFPLAASPMAVLLLVQAKVAPAILLENEVAGTVAPLQTLMLAGTITVAVGLTVIV
jgi:hypothetical protein